MLRGTAALTIYNSLFKSVDTTGSGRTVRALPIEPLKLLLKKRL